MFILSDKKKERKEENKTNSDEKADNSALFSE